VIGRSDDTIILPQTSTRADGVDPDKPECNCCERAAFHFHGQADGGMLSLQWLSDHDSEMTRLAVAATFIAENYDAGAPGGDTPPTVIVHLDNGFDAEVFALVLPGRRAVSPVPAIGVHEIEDFVWIELRGNFSAFKDISVFISMQCTELGSA